MREMRTSHPDESQLIFFGLRSTASGWCRLAWAAAIRAET
jgi:hypothetical protein